MTDGWPLSWDHSTITWRGQTPLSKISRGASAGASNARAKVAATRARFDVLERRLKLLANLGVVG